MAARPRSADTVSVAASLPARQVLVVPPGSAGRWLVETDSGSRHLLDLDAGNYTRRGEKVRGGPAWARGVAQPIHDVTEWPRVNARFGVRLVARGGFPALIASSYVTRIVRLGATDERMASDRRRGVISHRG